MDERFEPINWPDLDLEIPAASPAAVAIPPVAAWVPQARATRAALDASTVPIGDVPLGELRRRARDGFVRLAVEHTRRLGITPSPVETEVVLATGHQPLLVHPGIWVKYLALSRLVPPDGLGLNLIVDSDVTDEVVAAVPRDEGVLRRVQVPLARGSPYTPIEALAGLTADEWRQFAATVDGHLATIRDTGVAAAWTHARRLLPPAHGEGLTGQITALRRALEGRRSYLDLPVSAISGTAAFRRFAWAIMRDARRFAQIHNTVLAAYRDHYGVRTAAQPFPDLALIPDRAEVPFWYVAGSRRWPVFVETGGAIFADEREIGLLPDDPDASGFAALAIRPRALTLTAFARLVTADLFIHGVGGGRYDRATDAVVRTFFGIDPPAYATVTATLFLPFAGGGSREAERQRLLRLLLDLQHNPDRFLSPHDGPHQRLVDEKWTLIRRLETGRALTRKERREATRRIRELNTILQVAVADRVAEIQEELDRLDRHQADVEVTSYRGFPFFFFPVADIDALVDLLSAGGPAASGAPAARAAPP